MLKRSLGKRAEDIATRFLKRKGFKIITRNFSCHLGEIDIVAKEKDEIVFVEVRSINACQFMGPLESVSINKIRRLRTLAAVWLNYGRMNDQNVRFDVIGVVFQEGLGRTEVEHIISAF